MTTGTERIAINVRIYALVLGVISIALLGGGGWLVAAGGSPYYLTVGLLALLSAGFIWQQRKEGVGLYVVLLAGTLGWAFWEVGADGWALMPRLVAWFVVGAWMLTPWFRRPMNLGGRFAQDRRRLLSGPAVAGLLVVAALAGWAMHPLHPASFDPRFQTGFGPFPTGRFRAAPASSAQWEHWGNDQGGSRFSTLDQITPGNVTQLKVAWTANLVTTDAARQAGLEATALMIDDTLYTCNGVNEVFALDAETGRQRWHVATGGDRGRTCRGVAFYRVPNAVGPCATRILTATGNASLVALDAATGRRCAGFGTDGTVNLLDGLSAAPRGYYYVTSAPAVIQGKVVIGGWVSDGQFWGEPSGVVRAFDAATGRLSWAWDMGRPDRNGAPPPGQTYTPSTPNSWAPISADERLGLVYIPTGNATPDYFGAQRRAFDDRYSSSVVALDATSGKVRWSFQTVHHDLWDYDVASQPTLADIRSSDGSIIHALVQTTKRGEIFVLDRVTGRPLHNVVEQAVPQIGKVPEERLSPTQPFSVGLPSFRNPDVRESDMWGITPLDQLYCRIKFRQARYFGTMTPPGLTPWISSPGFLGGMDWGGASIDVDHGVMIVNTAKLANYDQLMSRSAATAMGLKPIGPHASPRDVGGPVAQFGTPYGANITAFLSPLGIPCQAPPYGYISAIDLVSGKLIWSHTLGTARDSGPFGIKSHLPIPLGTPTTGGSLTTRSGLVFIGATQDHTFRAIDERTGRELWQAALPHGGFATPMTYMSSKSGRQFVVIAAGGLHGLDPTDGANLVAYALPDRNVAGQQH